MKKGKNSEGRENVEFWQSATDLLLALLLILLLVVSLLLLYLMQLPESDFLRRWGTEQDLRYGIDDKPTMNADVWEPDRDDDGGGSWSTTVTTHPGGGGGDGVHETTQPTTETTQPTTPTERYPVAGGGGGVGDEWGKAAVLVNIIDGETNRKIREANVTFELYQVYNSRTGKTLLDMNLIQGTIRYLNTYYPEKLEYRNYKTNPDGLYYLPEKIETGGYYFKQISDLNGYDPAKTEAFEIDKDYDWNDPYVVSIPLYPSKNTIRISLIDSETGEHLTDGSFRVSAAQNIITADGTTRFVTDAVADVFPMGTELPYGESSELYLGSYYVQQEEAPRYYTAVDEILEITLEKRNGVEPPIHELTCRKTAIKLHLTDDLYATQNLEGAVFVLSAPDRPDRRAKTDAFGELTFTDLDKNTVYTLRQESAVGDYRPDKQEYTFYVDIYGRIAEQAEAVCELTNFIPRVNIGLQDTLLHNSVSGKNLSLYDASGNFIRAWTSSGTDEVVTGLGRGSYYILIDNKESARVDFTVDDPNEIGTVHHSIWTMQSILTLAAAVVIIPLLLYFLVLVFKKLFKKRNKNH